MSLFRKKKDESQVSAFDQIPPESQAKLIEDMLSIVRTVKGWPELIPTELHAGIANEVSILLRKTGLKLASAFLGNDDMSEGFGEALKGVKLPNFITQTFVAVKLALTDKFQPPETVTPEAVCPGGWPIKYGQHHPSCNICSPEGPDGKAA